MILQELLIKHNDDRAKTLAELKRYLAKNMETIRAHFANNKHTAIDTAAAISTAHDDIVKALFVHATHSVFPGKNKTHPHDGLSLCAVGGYGRGEMAPFSDLDLLFLRNTKADKPRCDQIAEYVLYMLWDMGLKVGHAFRSPHQCISLGRVDETVLTAMLDLRFLSGDQEPAAQLTTLLAKERTRSKKRNFIAAKLAARDVRHDREGNSRYVIEPNVKEGKGGLRDLHELYWIARFIYGGKRKAAPVNPHGVLAYMQLGLLDKKAAKRFFAAGEFLWKVRIHLHFLAGRATEVLGFDKQAELARRMGFTDKAPEKRVAAFMHAYFNTTREVGALTRTACAKLEADSQLLLPQGLDRLLPTTRRGLKEKGFVLEHGRLNFASPGKLKTTPILMLHLFRIAGARNLDIHPNAFQALMGNRAKIDDDFRRDPEAARVFYKILLDSKTPGAILRTMNEAGILGAYLTEFGAIVGRTQFNMHHAFTVDAHTLLLVHYLHDLECGLNTKEHPLTSGFIQDWNRRTRKLVYLACLFHDVGKAEKDQCADGARLATQAGLRLGLPDADVETIAWLVRHHLLMSETAQRRDISDPATVENFARTVGSLKRLQMLTALTVVDIRAVGPGIWNDWKGALLRRLYFAARKTLMGMDMQNGEHSDVQGTGPSSVLASLPRAALTQTHFVQAKLEPERDITQLTVLTRDRHHLFADLAGAIASCGASVIGAELHTANDGQVLNRFYLQNTQGLAFGRKNKARLQALERTTLLAARSNQDECLEFSLPTPLPSRRAEAIPVHPRVSVIKQEKGAFILEIEGRDRPGLLHALALVMCAHNLSIRSAHIEVLGPKAIDVFYVSQEADRQINEEKLRFDIRQIFVKPTQAPL